MGGALHVRDTTHPEKPSEFEDFGSAINVDSGIDGCYEAGDIRGHYE